jgi:hypothetical protein
MKLVGLAWGAVALLSFYFISDILLSEPQRPLAPSREKVANVAALSAPLKAEAAPLFLPANMGNHSFPTQTQEPKGTPRSDQPSTELNDTAVLLSEKFRTDPPANKEAQKRESSLKGIFNDAKLGDDGKLLQVSCKQSLCQGDVEFAKSSKGNQVLERTLMSGEFTRDINLAVSITQRRTLADGRVVATFFVHPDSILQELPSVPEDG